MPEEYLGVPIAAARLGVETRQLKEWCEEEGRILPAPLKIDAIPGIIDDDKWLIPADARVRLPSGKYVRIRKPRRRRRWRTARRRKLELFEAMEMLESLDAFAAIRARLPSGAWETLKHTSFEFGPMFNLGHFMYEPAYNTLYVDECYQKERPEALATMLAMWLWFYPKDDPAGSTEELVEAIEWVGRVWDGLGAPPPETGLDYVIAGYYNAWSCDDPYLIEARIARTQGKPTPEEKRPAVNLTREEREALLRRVWNIFGLGDPAHTGANEADAD